MMFHCLRRYRARVIPRIDRIPRSYRSLCPIEDDDKLTCLNETLRRAEPSSHKHEAAAAKNVCVDVDVDD